MKAINLIVILFLAAFFGWSCEIARAQEKTVETAPPQDSRNIPGIGMPRGLISKTARATPGYVLFSPLASDTTYLVNTDGEVVHVWDSDYGPSGWLYLKENGHLIRGGRDPEAPVFGGGGQGGWIQEFSWDGELVWEYRMASGEHLAHHDVALMPNGNILALAWESKTYDESLQAGARPEMIPQAGLWPDKIVELQPFGKNEARVVWQWHYWDHLVQDHDKTKDNYGDPSTNPGLLDINLGSDLRPPPTVGRLDTMRARGDATTNSTPENQGSDIYHTNSINYNTQLDQIVFGSPSMDEIYIIDHSTTTAEAAGHTGGRSGKGGDFLYRWGNPKNYRQGDEWDIALRGQHDIQWIAKGLPGEGNLLVFNNNVPDTTLGYSAILEITPPLSGSTYSMGSNGRYGPEEPSWKYIARDTFSFFGPFVSGAQRLPNGNTFICSGPRGRFFEVNPVGEVLWEYWTPFAGYVVNPDGTTPQPVGPFKFAVFRALHIGTDHPGLKGKSLVPLVPQPNAYVIN